MKKKKGKGDEKMDKKPHSKGHSNLFFVKTRNPHWNEICLDDPQKFPEKKENIIDAKGRRQRWGEKTPKTSRHMCIPPLSLEHAPNKLGSYHSSKTTEKPNCNGRQYHLEKNFEMNTTEQKKIIIWRKHKAKTNLPKKSKRVDLLSNYEKWITCENKMQ